MDAELLRRYDEELEYLRELGTEFAHDFPDVAKYLDVDATEVADPYVERLLEGFAFLAARIRLKLDAEYPRFVQHLLECVYPGFVAPTPSMAVLRFAPEPGDPNLARGVVVPRGSAVASELRLGQGTACEFRTAHAVCLWPIEIAAVEYFTDVPDLPLARLPCAAQVRGGLRIRLRVLGGLRFDALPLDALPLYFAAPGHVAARLHELVHGAALGTLVPAAGAELRTQWRDAATSITAPGFDAEHALLPETLRGFSGHRLVQEYAAMPQRLLFAEVAALAPRLARVHATEADIVILFSRGEADLESLVDAGSLALFCTPAINLFPKRLDRIDLASGRFEHHVVPDRARPLDFEVHTIDSVVGHGTGRVALQRFAPLYAPDAPAVANGQGWYTLRREPRAAPTPAHVPRDALRAPYAGSEVFLSLVDRQHAPYRDDVRQLALTAWVTNRDLPLLLPAARRVNDAGVRAGASAWRLDASAPVRRVDCVHGPTTPAQRLPQGEAGWALVSLLALNHASLAGEDAQRAAETLRRMLLLFGPAGDATWQRLVGGLLAVHARPATRRLPGRGRLVFGSAIDVALDVDERAFEGNSAFLFGSVVERFVARHAAVNQCTETTLRSAARGTIMRWPTRAGGAAVA